jgi:hypothetical protein
MKKLLLINFSLMQKIGDKKNGNVEDATSFITCTELFFVFLEIEFILISLLPIKVSPYILGGIGIILWYYTNYVMRKSLRISIANFKISHLYKNLNTTTAKNYFILSLIFFFCNFFLFFAITVWTLQGYYK